MERWARTSTAPVELVQVSPRQEVVCERLGVAHALNAGVHEAGVAEVTEARGTFFCRDWADKDRGDRWNDYNRNQTKPSSNRTRAIYARVLKEDLNSGCRFYWKLAL